MRSYGSVKADVTKYGDASDREKKLKEDRAK